MVEASCHCGAVQMKVATPPEQVTSCNCTICRRYGGLWAYYSPCDVTVTGPTDIYMRGDRMLEMHRCKICGCVTHWAPVDKTAERMGVNARMMDPEIKDAASVRYFNGADDASFGERP